MMPILAAHFICASKSHNVAKQQAAIVSWWVGSIG
jgi:hypothetical protein